jgi:hypothetical protein
VHPLLHACTIAGIGKDVAGLKIEAGDGTLSTWVTEQQA